MKIAVVGLGKIGLPVALRFAMGGAQVWGVDADEAVTAAVASGIAGRHEPGLREGLVSVLASGNLRVTTDTTAAVADAEAVVVLVRMVVGPDGEPDYSNLDAATLAVGQGLRAGTLVSYETTLPVGDTRHRFGPSLRAVSGLEPGVGFHLCFSPERVSAGTVLRDLDAYPKVLGGLTETCVEHGKELYGRYLGVAVRAVPSLETAELSKLAEAVYRDVNVALANELARYADEVGVDFNEVTATANSQPYSHLHAAGLGVGGHCIPVYPRFFAARASDARLTRLARSINDGMPQYGVQRLARVLGNLEGRRVLVLGLAFRGGVTETGFSVAIPLVTALEKAGARVRVHDPLCGPEGVRRAGYEWQDSAGDWPEALVLQADHMEYRDLVPRRLPQVRVVLDGRNALDPAVWVNSGVAVVGIGRTHLPPD